jgi:hypothetical protein
MTTTQRLPGLEDAKIEALQGAALEYAAVRDQRMLLTEQESGLKAKLLGLMKEYGKDVYEYDGVKVERVMEEETVKVRIKRAKQDDDTAEPDVEAAAAIIEEMQPDEESPADPLASDFNARNKAGRRKKTTA